MTNASNLGVGPKPVKSEVENGHPHFHQVPPTPRFELFVKLQICRLSSRAVVVCQSDSGRLWTLQPAQEGRVGDAWAEELVAFMWINFMVVVWWARIKLSCVSLMITCTSAATGATRSTN